MISFILSNFNGLSFTPFLLQSVHIFSSNYINANTNLLKHEWKRNRFYNWIIPDVAKQAYAYASTLIQTRLRHTLIQFSNPFTSQTNACTKKKKKKYRTRASRFPRYNFISSSVQCMFVLPHFPLLNWLGRTHIELWIFF